ncbi:MAG: 7,8-didemethyl-8-hydroxy-5-deazariboflavin synthase CofG [Acidimicrobiia bacterium]
MAHPPFDRDLAIGYLEGSIDAARLFAEATRLRDEGHGRTVTYSRKVFIPLTTMCRDRCTYCTFVKPPGGGGEYLSPDEVLAVARAGEQYGCTEALFTLGDRPEDRWQQARAFLDSVGFASTLEYVRAMTELVNAETSLFPHANPGLMSESDLRMLRRSNTSMGLMLENISERLMEPGMPHFDCPDKDPGLRMETLEAAGRVGVPFTSGILVGIGETNEEIVDSLIALEQLHRRLGHLQEIIVQNFRAKADTRMRRSPEPVPAFFARVVAVTRWLFGAEMNVQVPPNLTESYETYLEAGINDWGGVSPLTIDWVNPEQPWPHLVELEERTVAAGFELRPRLPVYPEFIQGNWIDAGLLPRVLDASDEEGYATVSEGVGS